VGRIEEEVGLLRKRFRGLHFAEPWVLIPSYPLPEVGWGLESCAVAFLIPGGYPGQKPYAFHTSPVLAVGGAPPGNTTPSTEPPFEGAWLKFSWDCPEWNAGAEIESGNNLLHWALSFNERLREFN
jgi:hypothetical protein